MPDLFEFAISSGEGTLLHYGVTSTDEIAAGNMNIDQFLVLNPEATVYIAPCGSRLRHRQVRPTCS